MTKVFRVAGAALVAVALSALYVSSALAQPEYALTVDKSADKTSLPAGGGTVEFTVTVTNTGSDKGESAALSELVVEDEDCELDGDGSEIDNQNKLSVGDWVSYTCTKAITKTFTNCASAFGSHDASGRHDAEDSDCVTVTVGTTTATVDDVAKGAGAAMVALILLAIGALGFLGTTNRLPKLPRIG